jgi:hypothetical protein
MSAHLHPSMHTRAPLPRASLPRSVQADTCTSQPHLYHAPLYRAVPRTGRTACTCRTAHRPHQAATLPRLHLLPMRVTVHAPYPARKSRADTLYPRLPLHPLQLYTSPSAASARKSRARLWRRARGAARADGAESAERSYIREPTAQSTRGDGAESARRRPHIGSRAHQQRSLKPHTGSAP